MRARARLVILPCDSATPALPARRPLRAHREQLEVWRVSLLNTGTRHLVASCGRPTLHRPSRVLRAAPPAREIELSSLGCRGEATGGALVPARSYHDSTAPTCAGSLAFLIIQNSSHVLLLRYSRICEGECKEYTVRRSRLETRA